MPLTQPSIVHIPETFVQTAWFWCGLVPALVALLYMLHWMRMRVLTRRMQQRLDERTRIARSLYDNLLQSVQGLNLAFRAYYETVPKDAAERERLAHTLKMAEQLLAGGRSEILELHTPASESALFDALSEFGYTLTAMGSHVFESRLAGAPRPLRERAYNEIYAIGRDCLFNAACHAQAGRVSLLVEYSWHEFHLVIRDIGRAPAGIEAPRDDSPAHLDMQGILERARSIGADLQVRCEPGRGTTVCLRLRKNLAYEARSKVRRAEEQV